MPPVKLRRQYFDFSKQQVPKAAACSPPPPLNTTKNTTLSPPFTRPRESLNISSPLGERPPATNRQLSILAQACSASLRRPNANKNATFRTTKILRCSGLDGSITFDIDGGSAIFNDSGNVKNSGGIQAIRQSVQDTS